MFVRKLIPQDHVLNYQLLKAPMEVGGLRGSNERSMEGQEEGEEEEQRVMRRHHEDTFTRKLER